MEQAIKIIGSDLTVKVISDPDEETYQTGTMFISTYHDQGHIAAKTLDFNKTIAITNGMPILRTSMDHGTI